MLGQRNERKRMDRKLTEIKYDIKQLESLTIRRLND